MGLRSAVLVLPVVGCAIAAACGVVPGEPPEAPPIEGTAPASDSVGDAEFVLYQSVDFWSRGPQAVLETGARWLPMIHNREVRASDEDWLRVSPFRIAAAIERLGLTPSYDGLFVMDYEPYVEGLRVRGRREVLDLERMEAAYIEAARVARERLPHAKIGFFGIPTVRGRVAPEAEARALRAEDFGEVWQHVDVVMPQIYSGRTDYADDLRRMDRWRMEVAKKAAAMGARAETGGEALPIVPFVHGATAGPRKSWIETEALVERVLHLRELGATGVVYWDAVVASPDDRLEVWPRQIRAIQRALADDGGR